MFLTSTLASTTKTNIETLWPSNWFPITENSQKMITAIAEAFADSFSDSLKASVMNGGTIVGGASAPGGPLVGGILSFSPGSLSMPPPVISSRFFPPDLSLNFKGKPMFGDYTVFFKTLVETLSSSVSSAFSSWTPGWNLPAGTALGGVAAWYPGPPTPTPGPWTAGTITPFLFIGQGANPSVSISTLSSSFDSVASVTPVTVSTDKKRTETTELSTPFSKQMLSAFSGGISRTVEDTFSQIMVKDPTGVGASGTSFPMFGNVTGTISGLVLDVA